MTMIRPKGKAKKIFEKVMQGEGVAINPSKTKSNKKLPKGPYLQH